MTGRQQPERKKKRKRSGNSAGMPLFVGCFDGTVTTDGRLWIPLKLRKQLEEHKVREFWVALHPAKAVVLLCPREFWKACKRKAEGCLKRQAGAESDAQEIWPLDEAELDGRGRITLHVLATQHLQLGGEDGPRGLWINARGRWFEVERD